MKIATASLLLCLFLYPARAEEARSSKLLYTNLAAASAIVGWGIWQWDYGERDMHTTREGWFGSDTENGGADKLGHLYTTYLATRSLAALYRSYGYESSEAARYAAYSSFFLNALMEVGDSFSRYGFSAEDMVMNTAGSCLGYLFERYDALDRAADIRLEYFPSRALREGESSDVVTDYDGMKFLVAVKGTSAAGDTTSWLRYVELHAGYYTRGNASGRIERTAYVGLGLNLSALLAPGDVLRSVLEYYQPPYTYLPLERDFDR